MQIHGSWYLPACLTVLDGVAKSWGAGINLLGAVIAESQYPEERSQALARQQYVHTLAYLLHGLPQDLDDHEATTLEHALPPQLQHPNTNGRLASVEGHSDARSLPHRALASGIVQLFLLLQILLPYIRCILRSAYEFERTHHVAERTVSASVSAADIIGKKSVEIAGGILRNSNGRIIQIAAALSIWWIEEVASGIHEGVESCVEMVDKGNGKGTEKKTAT